MNQSGSVTNKCQFFGHLPYWADFPYATYSQLISTHFSLTLTHSSLWLQISKWGFSWCQPYVYKPQTPTWVSPAVNLTWPLTPRQLHLAQPSIQLGHLSTLDLQATPNARSLAQQHCWAWEWEERPHIVHALDDIILLTPSATQPATASDAGSIGQQHHQAWEWEERSHIEWTLNHNPQPTPPPTQTEHSNARSLAQQCCRAQEQEGTVLHQADWGFCNTCYLSCNYAG